MKCWNESELEVPYIDFIFFFPEVCFCFITKADKNPNARLSTTLFFCVFAYT